MLTDNDGNIEHIEIEQQDKPPIFRFRPAQINVVPKYVYNFLLLFFFHSMYHLI